MRCRGPIILILTCILSACHVEIVVFPPEESNLASVTQTQYTATLTAMETVQPIVSLTVTKTAKPISTHTPQLKFRSVESGEGHTCALVSDGTALCWGKNEFGQLGDGSNEDRDTPVLVDGLEDMQALAAGWGHTCALTGEGAVYCWGYNKNGELGDGTTINKNLPVLVKGLSNSAEALSAGDDHTCVITKSGNVQCWGFNRSGQLGDGSVLSRFSANTISGLSEVQMLATGWEHTCALTAAGSVYCWGSNEFGQLGRDSSGQNIIIPVVVNGLDGPVESLTANGAHTCASLVNGHAQCWGNNKYGQLGDGTTEDRTKPVSVIGLEDGQALDAGGNHTCAIVGNGEMLCWGWNFAGQLGYEERSRQTEPVIVSGLPGAVADMGLGWQHTCVVLETGNIACWGANEYGQVWNNWQITQPVATCSQSQISNPLDSGGFHSCAIKAGGSIICWGSNEKGQLGVGTWKPYDGAVTVESLGTDVISVATGGNQSCALKTDGTVMCWGANFSGELGDGTFADRMEPVQVQGLPDQVKAIAAGGGHTCAVLPEGVACWGANNNNQLSNNFDMDYVKGLHACVLDISSLYDHTCAVTSEGAVFCWGMNNFGQLGDNITTTREQAVQVIGLDGDVTRVATGLYHSCVLTTDGKVKCWGDNTWGQLGDGTTESHLTAVDVAQGTERAVDVAAGFLHTCYLSTAGTVKCWGGGYYGQLGNGSMETETEPTLVEGLQDVVALEAGESHTCAMLADSTIMCWGNNDKGQLGAGDKVFEFSTVPVEVISAE
jgi:alpha-tubulin suppressor-like RCC1 family protein